MRYRITAPVANYRGDLAGLIFRAGSAEADSENDFAALEYCRRRGYTVEPITDAEPPEAEDSQDAEPQSVGVERPKDYAPKPEWVAYAANHPDESRRLSVEDADALTKAELVELYGK